MLVNTIIAVVAALVTTRLWFLRKSKKYPPLAENTWLQLLSDGCTRLEFFQKSSEWCEKVAKQINENGTIYRISAPLPQHVIVCCDYKLARTVLSGSAHDNIKECEKSLRIEGLNIFPEVSSLITYQTSHPERSKIRRFLSPPFSTINLNKTTQPILHEHLHQLLGIFGKYAALDEEFDMKEVSISTTFNILIKSLFNISPSHLSDASHILHIQEMVMREATQQVINPFRHLMFWSQERKNALRALEELQQFGKDIVNNYRAERGSGRADLVMSETAGRSEGEDAIRNKDIKPQTIMEHILAYNYTSELHRISDVIIFMIAGHETTAHTLSLFLFCLMKNVSVLKKLQKEIDQLEATGDLLGERDCHGKEQRILTVSDIAHADYLNSCLKESQRLYPIAPIVSRRTEEVILHNDMEIPKDSIILVMIRSLHRQSWLDRPEEYIPERWNELECSPCLISASSEAIPAPANQVERLKEMFMPFSLGKRNCIGQNLALLELRVIVANLVRYYDFELQKEPSFDFFITFKPLDLMIKVKKR